MVDLFEEALYIFFFLWNRAKLEQIECMTKYDKLLQTLIKVY